MEIADCIQSRKIVALTAQIQKPELAKPDKEPAAKCQNDK
jgi:hypothetical protein